MFLKIQSYRVLTVSFLVPIGVVAGIFLIRRLREKQWGWVTNNSSLKGKVFVITGANTGLGYETTKALATRQATVVMACRDCRKAEQAIKTIRRETLQGKIIPLELDLKSFESIKSFSDKLRDEYPHFHCIINNAGLSATKKEMTKENYEVHFGVNHLGHFLLIDRLKDLIRMNNSRIVVVASRMHERAAIDLKTLGQWIETDAARGRGNKLYNNSKLMNIYFARELYKQGFDVHVVCPGLCNTDLFRSYNIKWYHWVIFSPVIWLFLRSSKQGAQGIIYCATDNVNTEKENPSTGFYVLDLKQTKSRFVFSDDMSIKFWNESLRMCSL